jgi:hypothetical protein
MTLGHMGELLRIFHTNIRSVRKNFGKLVTFLNTLEFQYDIVALTETNLSSLDKGLYNLEGYNSFFMNLPSKGGGLCIFVHEDFIAKECIEFNDIYETHESLFIKVSVKNTMSFIVGCIYRPPRCSLAQFNEYLNNVLLVSPTIFHNKCILVGDFNINLCKVGNVTGLNTCFIELMDEAGFNQVITEPTRLDDQTGLPTSLIDHFWINFEREITHEVINFPFSDHLPIVLNIKLNIKHSLIEVKFRDLSMRNFDKFNNDKCDLFSSCTISSGDVNLETDKFMNWLNSIVDRYFPMKMKLLSRKRYCSPWLDKSIRKFINKKHKLFIALKKGLISYIYFKAYSNVLRIMIDRARTLYYRFKFDNCSDNSRKMWKSINNLLGRNKNMTINYNELVLNDGTCISDAQGIAEEFNKYFNSVPRETQAALDKPLFDYSDLVPGNDRSLLFTRANALEVESVIDKMKNKSNSSNIPLRVLKFIKNDVSLYISKLFNLSLNNGIYPDLFKCARMIPLFKSGSRSKMSNFRPISLLSLFNKIFEKMLFVRLNSFISDCNILSEYQFGFRLGKDTQRATLRLLSQVLPCLGSSRRAACIFLDFKKAFDTIDHQILSRKLHRYGIQGRTLDLIRSYLKNRFHFVQIDNKKSKMLECNVGVPQGSVLGPLLFILYTNDLHYLFKDVRPIMFADDTALTQVNECPIALEFNVNYLLYKIGDWCNFNRLALNCLKTKWMYFSYRRDYIPKLIINHEIIERVDSFKYLGFHIDDRLNHNVHVRLLTGKLNRLFFISKIICRYCSNEAARSFYFGMVHSIITYGLLVWGGALLYGATTTRMQRLHDKIILNLFRNNDETMGDINKIYKRERLMKLSDIYRVKCCQTIYQILNENYAPFLLDDLLSLVRNHEYNTRRRGDFLLPLPQVRSVRLNFLYRAVGEWNELDGNLRESVSSYVLRKKMTKKIIDEY